MRQGIFRNELTITLMHHLSQCDIAKVSANIKRRATGTQDSAQVILGRELGGISKAAAIHLPVLYHIRKNIRLQKQANQQLPRMNVYFILHYHLFFR